MKSSKIALSAILMPSVLLLAGNGGGTGCTGGGGSSTPPTFNLPATVMGVQAPATNGPTDYTLTLSGVASGLDLTNTTYGVWCTNPSGFVPGQVVDFSQNPPVLYDQAGTATYTVFNSYSTTTYTASPDTGFPGLVYQSTTKQSLTLSQEWDAVNYILNHLSNANATYTTAGGTALSPNVNEIQGAIWQLLHPTDGVAYVTDATSLAIYNDAVANGTAFIPGNGQLAAVILVPQTPAGSPEPFQGVLVPVTVKGGGCTGTTNVSFTKTASVTNANAFQLITYTYVVKNTGTTTLSNVTITDDNGTPTWYQDDVKVGTIASLAPNASMTFTSQVYLPIHLFAQVGSNAIFDTLIPSIPATPANALQLTYLVDKDAIDNTYSPKGPMFSALVGDYAQFQFHDSRGNVVSQFNADYISKESSAPSGYASAGLHGSMIYGSSSQVLYITSTLADNLNGYTKFYGDTTTSPANDVNWQNTFGYKVVVNKGIFGFFGMGDAEIELNHTNSSKFGTALCYEPKVICSRIKGTATLCATVCGCNTTYTTTASTCVTLNGCAVPTCLNYQHKCRHTDECHCPCANCASGHCEKCTQSQCGDARCGDNRCPQQCQCHCIKCEMGLHQLCNRAHCADAICHKEGCTQH